MALSGILCDDEKHYGEKYTLDECLRCVTTGRPRRCENALPLIASMRNNGKSRKDAGLSVTMLLDCPRKLALAQEHDYHEHPHRYLARWMGTLGHQKMEEYAPDDPNIIQEVRYRKRILLDGESFELTGKADFTDLTRKLIVDYKLVGSIGDVKRKPKDGHEPQVNMYRWLMWGGEPLIEHEDGTSTWGDPVEYDIRYGGIQYFNPKGQKRHRVRIWPMEETEAFILDHLRPIVHWRKTGELPPILEDVWGARSYKCDTKWCPLRAICDQRALGVIGPGDPEKEEPSGDEVAL